MVPPSLIFDPAGRRTAVLDANGHYTTMNYDLQNSLTAQVDHLNYATSYNYDGAGNRLLKLDPRGFAVTLSRETALPPLPPPRTVRASFPAHGSCVSDALSCLTGRGGGDFLLPHSGITAGA